MEEELDPIAKVAEDASIDIANDVGMQEVKNKVEGILENSPNTSRDNVVDVKEPDKGNLSSMVDPVVNSQVTQKRKEDLILQ